MKGRSEIVNIARTGAAIAAHRSDNTATIDDAIEYLERAPYWRSAKDLGNSAGSIFKTGDWEFTGQWKPSRRASNHGRHVRVWKLVRPQSLTN